MRKTIPMLGFMLMLFSWQASAQFIENFDSEIPSDWTVIDEDGQGEAWEHSTSNAYSAPGVARVKYEAVAHEDYLITPQINVALGVSDRISFYAASNSSTYIESFDVKLSTTGTAAADFTVTLANEIANGTAPNAYEFFEYDISAYDNQDVYIAVVATGTNEFYLYVDDVVSDAVPTCLAPTDVVVSGITTETAEVSWTANTGESAWEVTYGAPGFDPETEGTTVNATTDPTVNLTNLASSLTYELYVKADCGAGDFSIFSSSVVFSSACDVTTDFTEDFDTTDVGNVPNCFQTLMTNSTSETADMSVISITNAVSGDHVFKFYNSGEANAEYYLATPQLNTLVDGDHRLRFYFNGSPGNVDLEVGTMTDPTDASTFTTVEALVTASTFAEYIVNFDQASTDEYIAFKVIYSATYYSVYIDNIVWEETPSCIEPTALAVGELTPTTAALSWTEGGSADQWEVKYGEPNFDPETEGTSETANDNPNLDLTNLIPYTNYEVYVRAKCDTGGDSVFVGPVAFTTQCEASSIPFFDGFENGNTDAEVLAGCWTQEGGQWMSNISETTYNRTPRTGDWNATLKYNKNDWMFYALELEAGTTYELQFYARQDATSGASIQASYGTENTAAAMTNEIVASTPLVDGDYQEITGSFTPNTDGIYYVGIKGNLTFTPWYISVDDVSVTEDTTTCPAPTDVMVDNITETTANVSWTTNGTETEWEILYGELDFDPENEGTSVMSTDALGETLIDLLPETTYDVYVRAICDANDISEWTTSVEFTTLAATCEAPTDIVVDNITETTANVSWTTNGTETEWEILYGAADFDPATEGTSVMSTDSLGETLTGLTEDTTYEVYVRAICEDDIMSDWTASVEFTTEELGVGSEMFASFTYYPNPVRSELTLKSTTQIEQVNLYNLLGQQIINTKPSSLEVQLNMDSLPSGVYLMKVNIQGSQKTFRLIKE